MFLHFDRSGRYIGRTQRLTAAEVGCLPFVILFLLCLFLLPFLWPLAVYGNNAQGWIAVAAWNILLACLFVLVLGRPPRKPRQPEPPSVTPTITAGPRDWVPPSYPHDDGRRLI